MIIQYHKFESKRRFGVELEIGNNISKTRIADFLKKISNKEVVVTKYQQSIENKYWHIKNDASCGPKGRLGPQGIEIASYVGSLKNDIKIISTTANKLHDFGCRVNDFCGLHIHAEALDLTVAQVGIILVYWIRLQNCLEQSFPIRRRDNFYCKKIKFPVCFYTRRNFPSRNFPKNKIDFHLAELFYFGVAPNIYENNDRMINLSVVNYARAKLNNSKIRKTIELRWPEGTLQEKDIKCWLVLFLNFIDNCKNKGFPYSFKDLKLKETLMYLGLWHQDNVFSIFSEEIHETRVWLLERFIANSTKYKPEASKLLKKIT